MAGSSADSASPAAESTASTGVFTGRTTVPTTVTALPGDPCGPSLSRFGRLVLVRWFLDLGSIESRESSLTVEVSPPARAPRGSPFRAEVPPFGPGATATAAESMSDISSFPPLVGAPKSSNGTLRFALEPLVPEDSGSPTPDLSTPARRSRPSVSSTACGLSAVAKFVSVALPPRLIPTNSIADAMTTVATTPPSRFRAGWGPGSSKTCPTDSGSSLSSVFDGSNTSLPVAPKRGFVGPTLRSSVSTHRSGSPSPSNLDPSPPIAAATVRTSRSAEISMFSR